MFIKIGTKTAVVLVLAAAVIAWALIAPASLQAAVEAVYDVLVVGPLDMIKNGVGAVT